MGVIPPHVAVSGAMSDVMIKSCRFVEGATNGMLRDLVLLASLDSA